MEQQPHQEGLPADEVAGAPERERLIREGLDDARRKGRRINDLTAKRIARELDPGSGPLHEFAETGAIPDGVETDEAYGPWIGALREYFGGRLIRSAMPHWNEPGMD
jgi:hypothetical protein